MIRERDVRVGNAGQWTFTGADARAIDPARRAAAQSSPRGASNRAKALKKISPRAGRPDAAPRARASVDDPPRRAKASIRRVGCDTHLSEVTRVVLVHHNPVVVLATGVTTTGGMLAVLANTTMARGHVTALLAVLVSLLRRKIVEGRVARHVSLTFASSMSPRSSRVRPATRSPARADAKPSIGRERTRDGPAPANAGKRASRDAATRRERRGESSGQGTHVRRHLEALCGLPCGCARRRGRGERSSSGSRACFTESRAKEVSVGYTSRLITHTKRFFHVKKRERTVDGDRRAAR